MDLRVTSFHPTGLVNTRTGRHPFAKVSPREHEVAESQQSKQHRSTGNTGVATTVDQMNSALPRRQKIDVLTDLDPKVRHAIAAYGILQSQTEREEQDRISRMLGIDFYV